MSIRYLSFDRFFHMIFFAFLLGFSLLINGCGGGGDDPSPDPDPGPPPTDNSGQVPAEITSLLATMTVMASVTDADGVPIIGATVGDSGRTGSDGILMGDTQPTASGWYRINAPGYAQEYVKPFGSFEGKTTFAIRLTPVDTLQSWSLAAAVPVIVTVGDVLAPDMSVEFGATAFTSDVTLSVTVLNPLKTHTTLANLDTADALYITRPFEIRALDDSGQDMQLATGETAQVTFFDNGEMGAVPRLFWFDPDAGTWLEQTEAGCLRTDATHVQCQLSHFSQHGGGSNSPPAGSPPSDPQSAGRDTEKEFQEWTEGGDTSNGMPQSLLDTLTAEMDAVINWAKNHPSEEAKTLIINTIGRLMLLGYDGYQHVDGNGKERGTDELYTALSEVMAKLAAPHIDTPLCVNFEKIEHLTAQAMLLGEDETADALHTVFQELVERCNVIQGRIEYSIVLASDMGWPSWGFYSANPRESGASYWTEYHDINLVIHVSDTGGSGQEVVVDGSDKVETDFPLVVYRQEVNDMDYCSFDTFQRESYWGEPNKGQLELTVQAQADLAGLQYSNEMLTATSSINVQYKYFELGWALDGYPTPVCVKDDDAEAVIALWENYQGQLMEQYKYSQYIGSSGEELGWAFSSFTNEQLSTVWDIFDQEPDVTRSGSEDSYPMRIWRGSETLLNVVTMPGGEYEHKVIMRWDLQHIDYTKGKWVTHHQ